uniref:Tyrosine-protein kinase n=1 Tax=Dermatophagoides pteronyssinus TaxID=6956 RepID=A0A6P6Y4V5_DERPT|nr:tyrosine-protein kinase ITK/TSK-like isoform X2 [Dermatophagoides pteronyssinus]
MNAEFYQSKKAKFLVIAKHDYYPVNDETDLALKKGKQYEILDSSGVWWMARDYNGQIGLVPNNYLETIKTTTTKYSFDDDYYHNHNHHNKSVIKNDKSLCDNMEQEHHHQPIKSSASSAFMLTSAKSFQASPSLPNDHIDIQMFSLFQQLWFFTIDRETSEQLLQQPCNPNGCFLVRPSFSENKCLTLSVLKINRNSQKSSTTEVKHYLIQKENLPRLLLSDSRESSTSLSSLNDDDLNDMDDMDNTVVYFIRSEEKFASIESLIEHYRKHRGHLITKLTQVPCRANFIWQKNSMILQHQQTILNSMFMNNNCKILSKNNHSNVINRQSSSSKRFTTDLTRDKSWEIKVSDLQLLEELGSGQFGVVRHGKWKGKYDVAVKLMKEGTMSERDFIEEAKVMTKLQHPNLVKLHGICIEHRPICIVAEFMKHSSLLSFLRKNEQKILDSLQRIRFLLNMCIQVASGMAYLESHNYIHRDLAARNCLVGHANTVKVADFGLTRYVIDDEYTSSGGTKFPIRWAPPEVLWFTRFSSKSDVWAYGILTWEVFSLGKLPYGKLTNAEVVEKIREGYRLDKPKQWCPLEILQIMKMCWHEIPEKRPSFQKIEQFLLRLKERDLDKQIVTTKSTTTAIASTAAVNNSLLANTTNIITATTKQNKSTKQILI